MRIPADVSFVEFWLPHKVYVRWYRQPHSEWAVNGHATARDRRCVCGAAVAGRGL